VGSAPGHCVCKFDFKATHNFPSVKLTWFWWFSNVEVHEHCYIAFCNRSSLSI